MQPPYFIYYRGVVYHSSMDPDVSEPDVYTSNSSDDELEELDKDDATELAVEFESSEPAMSEKSSRRMARSRPPSVSIVDIRPIMEFTFCCST